MKEKEVSVPSREQFTNLQSGPSFKTRPIMAAKAQGTGKSSEVMQIQTEEERKNLLEDKQKRSQDTPKFIMIVMIIWFGILEWIRSSMLTIP